MKKYFQKSIDSLLITASCISKVEKKDGYHLEPIYQFYAKPPFVIIYQRFLVAPFKDKNVVLRLLLLTERLKIYSDLISTFKQIIFKEFNFIS